MSCHQIQSILFCHPGYITAYHGVMPRGLKSSFFTHSLLIVMLTAVSNCQLYLVHSEVYYHPQCTHIFLRIGSLVVSFRSYSLICPCIIALVFSLVAIFTALFALYSAFYPPDDHRYGISSQVVDVFTVCDF